MKDQTSTVFSARDLKVHFKLGTEDSNGNPQVVHAVDGVSFDIPQGTTLGIIGESGCGKSTTALAAMQLLHNVEGTMQLSGVELSSLSKGELRQHRKKFQIIFQDPYSSLNPRQRVGSLIRTPLDLLDVGTLEERDRKVDELLELVGLRPEARNLFPHQFSGGQRQRIGIARALATSPDLIVCDEPVSALDVAIQAQILNLMKDLQDELQLTYLFISHDMGVVSYLCHEVAVMYLGVFVEQGNSKEILKEPLHPYTRILLSAIPKIDPANRSLFDAQKLAGDPPSPINPAPGCRFASRCPHAKDICKSEMPALQSVSKNGMSRRVACHFAGEI
ncbi:ABC transporter ATP-binding protein [Phaeobacter piscinae]|uniref:ABC transporter ATP-binding protein n=1 Tax=Phaeobacter piscinae TaxID=1580596 RepID=UPI00058D8DFA|nr:oligopeptide/dipeptide ABC transporter ATP-binding protein [Phaeobacter piscinae]UTS82638.1 Vitamin B12 import ATP-binding protein BtuD [Phaeobacter piscinae]